MRFSTTTLQFGAAPLAVLALCASFSKSDSPAFPAKAMRRTVPAHLDIKPGSCPNPINVRHFAAEELMEINGVMTAVVPVSILGNKFDVSQVDVGTVSLGRHNNLDGGFVQPIQINFSDTGTPFEGEGCDCHALAGDGTLDLDMKFDKTELIKILGLGEEPNGTFVELQVSGLVEGELEFVATDCVRIINDGL